MGEAPVTEILNELRALQQAGERHLHADHVQTVAARPDMRLVVENMQTLCSTCHNRKSAGERQNL